MKLDRLTAIRSHLYTHGPTSIGDLATAVGASLATVRRDLQSLEESGVVDRVHGGAKIAEGSTVEVDFGTREHRSLAAKRAIAVAAYSLLEPHMAVFLDAGTTVLQVARLLRMEPMPLSVFTNGLKVAQELYDVPKLKVFVLGGHLRYENASLIGPQAEAMLQTLWFDTLLLGASAVTADGVLCSIDGSEASLNGKMLARSTRQVLLADSRKFGTTATFAVGPIPAGATIVSDAGLSAEWRQRIRDWKADLYIAVAAEGAA
ncbi:DeoR/GlpR family DNA-binding transcription regulator [Aureimonas leprariae]|uniref:DeoR/GlpR transcriptional regulator n=1 Tax=Plantimonas leprariae TaxID=2615207 RepID=A0A7V7PTC3_9HYPH|nr:DeoR/GlpR family DNA-binding transcription regulator [Aureimonas leprariae]KAB0682940.1 DeoR/GlpR transcriptional regulator [Aureimonas leprariae]